jgi:hypothetical protein
MIGGVRMRFTRNCHVDASDGSGGAAASSALARSESPRDQKMGDQPRRYMATIEFARACLAGSPWNRQSAKMRGITPLFPKDESAVTSLPRAEVRGMARRGRRRVVMARPRPTCTAAASGSANSSPAPPVATVFATDVHSMAGRKKAYTQRARPRMVSGSR